MIRLTICCVGISLVLVGCSPSEQEQADFATESTTAVAFNIEGAPTVQFDVPDMMCEESCAAKVHELLGKQPGVKEVVVDFPARTATVAIEEGEFDADAAVAVLVDYGFDHSQKKSAATDSPEPAVPAAPEAAEKQAG